ncbi:histidine kinase [Odoribacter sp. OttesenSCG-928-J03]|nr:histidine kinase [Odoribacter sp. OttesenSCG-928-J03]MDL2283493.1 histidine kinase [Odoribacter sp. OttesenSCG-928-G04]
MQRNLLTYRSAAIFALAISLLMHFFFLIMFLFGREAVMPTEGPPRHHAEIDFYRFASSFVANFVFAFILYVINFKILKSDIKMKVGVTVTVSLIATIALSYLLTYVQMEFFDFGPHRSRAFRGGIFRDSFLTVIVIFSSQIIYLSYKKQQILLENERLMAENVRTRYTALKNQIDPHFLFNTLNTLNSIIKTDSERAQEYVQKLSAVFRYTLQNKEVITLGEEIKFTRDYCSLMQIRYGESLQFHFDIAEHYNNYLIVPLSVQTLVENAIKHNVITNRQPLTITIATADNDTLTVRNPLQLKKEREAGEGIGLPNLTERYRLKWAREIEIKRDTDAFSVTIPLIHIINP